MNHLCLSRAIEYVDVYPSRNVEIGRGLAVASRAIILEVDMSDMSLGLSLRGFLSPHLIIPPSTLTGTRPICVSFDVDMDLSLFFVDKSAACFSAVSQL